MIYKADEYAKNGDYIMPNRSSEDISPEEKDKGAYNLQMAQSVYHEFTAGTTHVGYGEYSTVERNRSYMFGDQSEQIYIDSYYGVDRNNTVSETVNEQATRDHRRKAGGNLNFSIQSPAPRLVDSLIGKLSDLINMVSVDPTDKYSGAQKESAKWLTWTEKKYRGQLNSLKALMALPQQDEGFTPENLEELNLYEAEGGFKPSYATTMEQLLKFSFERSAWDENIVEKILADLISSGFAAVKDVYDRDTGQVKCEYLDARTAGVQYTNEESYRKPDFGFYIKMVRVSDLKEKGFTEDELNGAADKFQNYFGNDKYEDPNYINKNNSYGYAEQSDKYIVPVFVVNWIDVDNKKEVSHTNRYGSKRTRDYDGKAKLGKKDEIINTRIKTVREVHWIIDTDMIYDYGRVENQGRDGLSDPVLPIHMVKVHGKPLIPRLIPILDLYMNSWMKFQQGIRMSTIDGHAIDMSIINNINLGGRVMNPKDVIKAWKETGVLFFSSVDSNSRINQTNHRPIEKLDGGAGAVMQEQVTAMDWANRQIEQLTGINPLTMGEAPEKDVGKRVSEFSIMGTSDILKNIVKKANVLKSEVARSMCVRLQYVVKNKNLARTGYEDVVGKTSLELLKIAEGHDVKYGIRTHARPTDQDIAELKEMISLSLKNGRDGKVGITEADFVRFNAMINAGDPLKRVAMLLGAATRKAQREAEQRAIRSQQLDQQGAQQLVALKDQADTKRIALESQAKIAEENIKGRNSIIEAAMKDNGLGYIEALAYLGINTPQQAQQQPIEQEQIQEPPAQESSLPVSEEAI